MHTRSRGVIAAIALLIAGCEFDVTNPGPTPDELLDQQEAHQAIANGAAYIFAQALNTVAYTTSAVTRELFPAGSTSSFGISGSQQIGILRYNDEHADSWTNHQRARFIAEDGFARFDRVLDGQTAGYQPSAEAALWAGYANRLLGENWCEAVFNGGSPEPGQLWFDRAEEWFTTAIGIADGSAGLDEVVMAALAGRASVRMHLGDWAGAVADAGEIPSDFVFQAQYHDTQQDIYNRIYFGGANEPYRAITVWNTVYEEYYTESGDPRTPWRMMEGFPEGDAALAFLGNRKVPFYQQQKYDEREADINLSSGHEMRLIEAESLLRDGQWQAAMEIINGRRAEVGVPAFTAGSETDAWTALKRERGIELWLEGRRMGDLRRWQETGTPGALEPLERAGDTASFLSADQTLCYDIPQTERETNPNVPAQP